MLSILLDMMINSTIKIYLKKLKNIKFQLYFLLIREKYKKIGIYLMAIFIVTLQIQQIDWQSYF